MKWINIIASKQHLLLQKRKILNSQKKRRYYTWIIRTTYNVRVWKNYVLEAQLIPDSLQEIKELSRNIWNIFDVFEIHGKMYYTHLFYSENKRTCRIIKELFLPAYWYTNRLPTSYGYYILDKYYINFLVKSTLKNNNFEEWANFAYFSSLLIVFDLLHDFISKLIGDNILVKWMDYYNDILPRKYNFLKKPLMNSSKMV